MLQKFGNYEILRKLSRGMTDVYLASDTSVNRRVVLKLVEHSHDEFSQLVITAEQRGALLQRQMRDIDPRILEIYDFGEHDNCFFVAMEYFPGRTLAEILQSERRIEARRAGRYAAEICSQLRTLHSFVSDMDGRKTAVVHGDIKPSNVQIGAHDELRLLDFGIAKAITATHNLTHHNLGSPSYCSPERISKSQVDPHADLWATGVTLYEMLAGTPPYQAQDTRKLENLIQSRRPPRALPADCPAALKTIVAKALAPDLSRRYCSAEAFELDLQEFLAGRRTTAERERPSSWDSNATVEKHPTPSPAAVAPAVSSSKSATPPVNRWNDATNITISLLAGILVGLIVFIPIGNRYRLTQAAARLSGPRDYAHADIQSLNADWNLYRQLKSRGRSFGLWSPASLDASMHAHLIAAADDILDAFRHSPDGRPGDFDWNKASLCLRHALEIEPADSKAKGELALCTAYGNLTGKAAQPTQAFENFRDAEWFLPRSPDPHLGLGRLYVYSFHNIGRAAAEFHQAEQLGYQLGPKEDEQQADGYLFRAELALARARRLPNSAAGRAKWLRLARDDMERARKLYEPIAGFSNVSANLEQLRQDGDEQTRLQMENIRLVSPRPHASKHYASIRPWQ